MVGRALLVTTPKLPCAQGFPTLPPWTPPSYGGGATSSGS
jgi:hypothetical protein